MRTKGEGARKEIKQFFFRVLSLQTGSSKNWPHEDIVYHFEG